jgi:Ras-related GTP-binding protein A/B
MENYLSQQRVHVFSNVGVLIYVFDIESRDVDRDLATYVSIIAALTQYSPTAKVYVLIHKMDLTLPHMRENVFMERVRLVRQKTAEFVQGSGFAGDVDLTPFATSIQGVGEHHSRPRAQPLRHRVSAGVVGHTDRGGRAVAV